LKRKFKRFRPTFISCSVIKIVDAVLRVHAVHKVNPALVILPDPQDQLVHVVKKANLVSQMFLDLPAPQVQEVPLAHKVNAEAWDHKVL
jgi:hypothetical protein